MKKLSWKMFRRLGGAIFKAEDYLIHATFDEAGDPSYEIQADLVEGEPAILGKAESFELAVDVCDGHRRLSALDKL